MKGLKTINGWSIIGIHGLYVGWHFTCEEMIYQHTNDLGRSWDECRKNGDRAIKVQITYFSFR
jgi:hypothetical protein